MVFKAKSYSLNWDLVNSAIKALCPSYGSLSTRGTAVVLSFTSIPSQAEKDAIQAYWDALSEASDEAVKCYSREDYRAHVKALKLGAVSKSWDNLDPVERKAAMGLVISHEELYDHLNG